MRTELDLIRLVEGAFDPCKCTASVADYGNLLHITIDYPDGALEKDVPMREALQDHVLAVHIEQLREFLRKRKIPLHDWKIPAK